MPEPLIQGTLNKYLGPLLGGAAKAVGNVTGLIHDPITGDVTKNMDTLTAKLGMQGIQKFLDDKTRALAYNIALKNGETPEHAAVMANKSFTIPRLTADKIMHSSGFDNAAQLVYRQMGALRNTYVQGVDNGVIDARNHKIQKLLDIPLKVAWNIANKGSKVKADDYTLTYLNRLHYGGFYNKLINSSSPDIWDAQGNLTRSIKQELLHDVHRDTNLAEGLRSLSMFKNMNTVQIINTARNIFKDDPIKLFSIGNRDPKDTIYRLVSEGRSNNLNDTDIISTLAESAQIIKSHPNISKSQMYNLTSGMLNLNGSVKHMDTDNAFGLSAALKDKLIKAAEMGTSDELHSRAGAAIYAMSKYGDISEKDATAKVKHILNNSNLSEKDKIHYINMDANLAIENKLGRIFTKDELLPEFIKGGAKYNLINNTDLFNKLGKSSNITGLHESLNILTNGKSPEQYINSQTSKRERLIARNKLHKWYAHNAVHAGFDNGDNLKAFMSMMDNRRNGVSPHAAAVQQGVYKTLQGMSKTQDPSKVNWTGAIHDIMDAHNTSNWDTIKKSVGLGIPAEQQRVLNKILNEKGKLLNAGHNTDGGIFDMFSNNTVNTGEITGKTQYPVVDKLTNIGM